MATKKSTPSKKAPAKKSAAKTATAKKSTVKKTTTVRSATPKELATKRGEPYVEIIGIELDPDNVGSGAFEIDWNDIFLAKLIRAGYQGKTDADIVDNWFKTICKNIVTEEFEQWEANQPLDDRPRIVERRNLGNGFTEIS